MPEGKCSVCGLLGKLSKEHIPPKKAFNDSDVFLAKIDKERTVAEVRWKKYQRQGGNFGFVLCERCNNNTGSWYGDYYVDFMKQCADYAHQGNGGKQLTISVNIFPLRIFKQVLTILCASCGPGLSEKSPGLRKIILNKECNQRPANLNVWLYLRAQGGGRSSGITGVSNTNTGENKVVAEFSWWPVGWVLSFNDNNLPELTNITNWYSFGYNDKRNVTLNLNCHWTTTAYPLDYRDPDTVESESRSNK